MAIGKRWRDALEHAWWRPHSSFWSVFLWPLSALYRLLWQLRAALYSIGALTSSRAPVPFIVVGNLIVGGAGKTPCVIALAHALKQRGWSPGIVSRGHGSQRSEPRPVQPNSRVEDVGDEPLLMRRRTSAPVWVGQNRVATARALLQAHPDITVLIADDGLQRRSLHRDAQLVVFDDRGIGNGCLLPAGPMREPMWKNVPDRSLARFCRADWERCFH
jgi:tetraacyldisaccharide 4'-kinase